MRQLLLPSSLSYGAGPNIAYLASANLSCQTVHRRDSDVFLDPLRSDAYPIELELRAIGNRVGEVVSGYDDMHRPIAGSDDRVCAVGTGTFGAPTADRRDLIAAGYKYLVAFQQLGRPGILEEQVRTEALNSFIREPMTRYNDDFYEIDVNSKVEMECCCLSWITRVIPEMPTAIPGCDYMGLNVAKQTGHLALFHSRKQQHAYDATRAYSPPSVDYCLRDLQYIQIGRLCSFHNPRIRANPRAFLDGEQSVRQNYVSSFRRACAESKSELSRVRLGAIHVYNAASNDAPPVVARRLRRISNEIARQGEVLDEGVIMAVQNFLLLVEAWPELVAASVRLRGLLADSFVE